jgi:hypothetical protein
VKVDRGWSKPFEDRIALPNGRKLVTLLEAGNYIASLPRKEAEGDHWQAAIEALIMAAEDRGPLLHARRDVASLESACEAGVQPVAQRDALGATETQARRIIYKVSFCYHS